MVDWNNRVFSVMFTVDPCNSKRFLLYLAMNEELSSEKIKQSRSQCSFRKKSLIPIKNMNQKIFVLVVPKLEN